jgi:hypothetical protein
MDEYTTLEVSESVDSSGAEPLRIKDGARGRSVELDCGGTYDVTSP